MCVCVCVCDCVNTDKQMNQEVLDASSNSHCFSQLQPETVYRISVYSRLETVEGAAVSILHSTGQTLSSYHLVSCTCKLAVSIG